MTYHYEAIMSCKDCHVELMINIDLPGYPAGKSIKVEAVGGIPKLKYWRDRIKDSLIDGCVSVVEKTPAKKTRSKSTKTAGESK